MSPPAAILRRLLSPALAAAALTACDASTIISKVDIAPNYRPIELGRYSGGDNALRVIVYGSPFGDPPARVAEAVVAAMQGNNGGPRVTFSADPAAPPNPRWRAILAVNPTELRDTIELCKLTVAPQTASQTTPAQGGRLRIMAAFCQGDYAATQATGRGKEIASLDSPNFRFLLAQLTRALFPNRNPHDDRRCRFLPCL